MYEVWWTRGNGMKKGPEFQRLEYAVRYMLERSAWASFAVRSPSGTWCRGPDGPLFPRATKKPAARKVREAD